MPTTPDTSSSELGKAESSDAADGDDRGRFGYGRPAHGSDPSAQYRFVEPPEREPLMSGDRREIYRNPNGDCWFLARDPKNNHGIVIHEPNESSGGRHSFVTIEDFLGPGSDGPEHQALLRLIGTG